MGGAAADYDNEGDADLFTTGVAGNHLFRNNGAGVFTDVIAASGLAPSTGFATSAAWVDYDKDGALDLLVIGIGLFVLIHLAFIVRHANLGGNCYETTFSNGNVVLLNIDRPAITGGRLYLRDKDRLLCYDVRAK
jgi:hypothetical protein